MGNFRQIFKNKIVLGWKKLKLVVRTEGSKMEMGEIKLEMRETVEKVQKTEGKLQEVEKQLKDLKLEKEKLELKWELRIRELQLRIRKLEEEEEEDIRAKLINIFSELVEQPPDIIDKKVYQAFHLRSVFAEHNNMPRDVLVNITKTQKDEILRQSFQNSVEVKRTWNSWKLSDLICCFQFFQTLTIVIGKRRHCQGS